ncbi:hypothetical protein [Chondromyces apiculatus]|uniref:Lipoprotein n=1 Tax=Chondromyces apiculatus DSM 436 TaxID=1192034 RepID=A0A017SY33_9BACT|nr:hypothetical protein [Chondromyces apiculatus]EYF01667.1 Hypothetical protein CAP_7872 [Chondromyces apiculatus DSM 436]
MRPPTRLGLWLSLLLCASGAAACDGGDDGDPAAPTPPIHPAWRRTRLVVADADAPQIEVIDIEFGESVGTLPLAVPALDLVVSGSGEHVLATHLGGADVIYPGISLLDHSEGATDSDAAHIHVYKFPPRLLDYALTGTGVPRAMAYAHRFSVLFPGELNVRSPLALSFDEQALLAEPPTPPEAWEIPMTARIDTAIPLGDDLLVAGDTGLMARSGDDAYVELARDCPTPPVARAGGSVAVACSEELVRVEPPASHETTRTFFHEAGAPRPLALTGHVARALVLAYAGGTSVDRHDFTGDPLSSPHTRSALTLPAEACDLALDPAHGETLTVLSPDGVVRLLDADDGALLAEQAVVAPFSCADAVRPRLAQAPARAYVSDPARREIHALSLDGALDPVGIWPLQVVPSSLAVAGIDEATRNLGDLSDTP